MKNVNSNSKYVVVLFVLIMYVFVIKTNNHNIKKMKYHNIFFFFIYRPKRIAMKIGRYANEKTPKYRECNFINFISRNICSTPIFLPLLLYVQ